MSGKTIKKSLGGDRLGSGAAMDVEMNNFERSTHNLSQDFYTSMGVGTLNVVDCQLGIMGDTFYIDPKVAMFTLPTTLPSFAQYEMRVDYFKTPTRLFNKQLMMNNWNLGRDVSKVKYPMMMLKTITPNFSSEKNPNEQQIAPTSLLNQMGLVGLGKCKVNSNKVFYREKNAMPLLTYWRIYKDYYANKQEGIGYVIDTDHEELNPSELVIYYDRLEDNIIENCTSDNEESTTIEAKHTLYIPTIYARQLDLNKVKVKQRWIEGTETKEEIKPINQVFNECKVEDDGIYCTSKVAKTIMSATLREFGTEHTTNPTRYYCQILLENHEALEDPIKLKEFDLNNIEDMTERIFQAPKEQPLYIGGYNEELPYSAVIGLQENENGHEVSKCVNKMSGLGIKTYKSDWFNNWLDTEMITGDNGINALTSIDTSSGSFSLDAFNIGMKLWKMNNRIALSGGSINDWREVQYGERAFMAAESPIYCGSTSLNIEFDLVVSNAESGDQPLGTLAGRGVTDRRKNGNIEIHCDEECIIMAIASITPKIVYSQGNEWLFDIETMADLHVPSLDGIAFQELNTEYMCAWDTEIDDEGKVTTKSVGLQCAWQEYMTRVDRASGEFAQENNLMIMTNNRQYGWDPISGKVLDFTTYIDPTKHVEQFANGRLDSQNFWAVIRKSTKARRKMAAKQIPNI